MPNIDCSCTFEFERPNPVFYAGEAINGRVVLNTTTVYELSALSIQCDSRAEVSWVEEVEKGTGKRRRTYNETFHNETSYVENRNLIGRDFNLGPGEQFYDFSIELPEDCVSSFEQKFGRVSYVLRLKLEPSEITFEQPITVLEKVDLNLDPQNAIAVEAEEVKYFCCLFCSSGPAQFTLTLPFCGFVAGQAISYQLEMDNQSQYDLKGFEVRLQQVSTFHASHPKPKQRQLTVSLAQQEFDERCLRLSKRAFERELVVPSVPPTTHTKRKIISIRYFLEVIVRTGSCHLNTEFRVPIVIGTTPLMDATPAEDEDDMGEEEYDDGSVDYDDDEDGSEYTEDGSDEYPTPPEPSAPEYNEVEDNPPSYEVCVPPTYAQATNGSALKK